MNWILIALIAPALWSITNHLDKYLLSRYIKGGGVGALMVFSSMIGIILLPIIYFIQPEVIQSFELNYLLMSLNGMIYVLATLPYFYALQNDETSLTIPLFQLIPVYSFILGYIFLGETLGLFQLVGGLLIIAGSILISLKIETLRKMKLNKSVFYPMALSSFLFAINFILFKVFAIEEDFLTTSFWEYIGFAFLAVLLLVFVNSYRKEFLSLIKQNSVTVLTLNGINEIINIIAKLSFNFASLLVPVTLVWIINGSQPFFVFIYGVFITLLFPKIAQEDISKDSLIQKIVAIVVIFVGTILIYI